MSYTDRKTLVFTMLLPGRLSRSLSGDCQCEKSLRHHSRMQIYHFFSDCSEFPTHLLLMELILVTFFTLSPPAFCTTCLKKHWVPIVVPCSCKCFNWFYHGPSFGGWFEFVHSLFYGPLCFVLICIVRGSICPVWPVPFDLLSYGISRFVQSVYQFKLPYCTNKPY